MSRVLFSIGIIQALVILVGLVRSKTLSILLGPAGFGVVSTIDQVVMTVVSLASLSLPFTAMKFMARSHSEGEQPFKRTYAAFLRVLAVLALGAVVVVSGLLALRPSLFGSDLVPYRGILHLALLAVPALMLNILFVNTLAATQRPESSAVLTLVVALALALAGVAGAASAGIPGLYVATVIAGMITTAGTLRYLARQLHLGSGAQPVRLSDELRRNPEIVRFSVYIYLAVAAYSLTMLATRYFVFSRLGEVEAGLLQAVLSIALTAGAVLAPMSSLYLTPLVNRQMPPEAKMAAANDFAGKMIILLLLVSLPMVLFPRLVLTVLFSSQFALAANVLFFFVLWQCLHNIVNIFLQLLIGLDDVPFWAVVTGITYACAILLFPTLISQFGLGGAAMALITGMALSGVVAAMRLRLKFAVTITARVWTRTAICLGMIAAPALLFDVSGEWTLPGSSARVLYGLAALAITWAALSRDERALLGQQMRRLRR